MRGSLALPNRFTGRPVPLRRPLSRDEFFLECLADAVGSVGRSCPESLAGVDVGAEEVPGAEVLWRDDKVPLAAAVEATPTRAAQIVLFQRPLEHRAASREGLRILVHRTLVEQLSALTGRSVSEIDPEDDEE